jgi:ferric-dicitrate binding protein FerR (iron transport regulator)
MMKRDPRHIHALMTSWLTGDITQEEALHLKQLITEDPAIKAAWMEFREKFSTADRKDKFERFEELPWIPAEEITGAAPRPKRIHTLLMRAAGLAAAIVTIIVVGWYLFNKGRQPEASQPVAKVTDGQPENKKDIQLQLANGQTINLSGTSDSILLKDARLNNAGKTLSYTLVKNDEHVEVSPSLNRLTVPIGKDYKITLSDGTEVWLNSATTLQFPFRFTGKTREIIVHGEAYLKVAQHAKQPFLVHTQHGTVQVLGTSFNINDYDSGVVKVALVEGAVRFKAGEKDVTIKPGLEAVYTQNKGIRMQAFDEDDVLAWRSGRYYFYDATLEEIISVLPRWYGITVVIDNPSLSRERFTGMMDRNKPVQKFLDALSKTMKITYQLDKDILHLQ